MFYNEEVKSAIENNDEDYMKELVCEISCIAEKLGGAKYTGKAMKLSRACSAICELWKDHSGKRLFPEG